MEPFCQHITQFVKLVYHRRNDEPYHTTNDGYHGQHGDDDGQGSDANMHFVFYKQHDGVEQVCKEPCNEEWQQHTAQIISDVEYS